MKLLSGHKQQMRRKGNETTKCKYQLNYLLFRDYLQIITEGRIYNVPHTFADYCRL